LLNVKLEENKRMSHNYHRSMPLAVLLALAAFAVSVRPAHAQSPPPPTLPVVVSIFPPDGCWILAGNCNFQALATQVRTTSGGTTVGCSGPLPEPAPHARPKTAHCDMNNNAIAPGTGLCEVVGAGTDVTTTNWSETITGAGPFNLKCKFP
jgi:hypothetical protein